MCVCSSHDGSVPQHVPLLNIIHGVITFTQIAQQVLGDTSYIYKPSNAVQPNKLQQYKEHRHTKFQPWEHSFYFCPIPKSIEIGVTFQS